jgi:hypothetical protein
MSEHYDVVIVGTAFAASFFLLRYLEHAPPTARILVLERGNEDPKGWQLANRHHSSIEPEEVYDNDNLSKDWYTSPGFGGNSKCWMGGTTRMMPGDFQLKSHYGVGSDWPISYDDLEKHYGIAEQVMQVSGPSDSPMPRSVPFPQPQHRFSDPDVLLKKRFPDGWYGMATARSRPSFSCPAISSSPVPTNPEPFSTWLSTTPCAPAAIHSRGRRPARRPRPDARYRAPVARARPRHDPRGLESWVAGRAGRVLAETASSGSSPGRQLDQPVQRQESRRLDGEDRRPGSQRQLSGYISGRGWIVEGVLSAI